jgi:hypothetical protein
MITATPPVASQFYPQWAYEIAESRAFAGDLGSSPNHRFSVAMTHTRRKRTERARFRPRGGRPGYFSGLPGGATRQLLRSELRLRNFLFIAAVGVAICFIAAIVMFGYWPLSEALREQT